MSRICVPGLLALLAAAPHTSRGGDEVDLWGGGKIEIKLDIKKLPAEAQEEMRAMADALEERRVSASIMVGGLDFRFDPKAPVMLNAEARVAALEEMFEVAIVAEGDFFAPPPMQVIERVVGGGAGVVVNDLFGDQGEAVVEGEEAEESEARALADDEKKALESFVKKAVEAKRKQFAKAMDSQIDAEVKDANLDKAARKKLEGLVAKAVEASMPAWEKAFRKYIQPVAEQNPEGAKAIEGWIAENYTRNVALGDAPPPQETDEWKNGVKGVLTAEQWTAREEAKKSEDKKWQEDMGDYLATCEGQAGDQMSASIEAIIHRIVQFGEIDESRQKKLKAAADEAVKLTVKDWRARTEKQLKAMPKEQREQMTSRGGMMSVNATEKENQPQEKQVWKDAFAQILSDAERKIIEDRRMEVRGRRADALAMILVGDLDRLIGFSDKQRDEFLTLSAKRMLKLPDYYFTSPENGGYYSIDTGQMLQQLKGLKNDQVAAILDEGQMKRWKSSSADQMSRGNSYIRTKMDTGDVPKAEDMDEVEVERIVSSFLHREARKMKLKMLSQMEAQVEQIRRVVNPAPEMVAILTTAAKGAAEELAANSINNLSSWVRGQFQNVKPSDVPARLQNLYNPYFSERNQLPNPKLWTAAVERLLNSEQRTLWKKELDAREAWRRKGLSAIVITDLEKRLILKPEQRDKLHKKLDEVIAQYEPDFSSYFSFGWHLQGYYAMIPIAMFTDKEMEEHFDKKQIETVKEKCLQNAGQYAEMIKRQHKSRTGK